MDIRSKVIDVYVHVYLYEMRLVLQCMKSKARRIVRNAVGADGWKGMWEDIESVSKQIDDGIQSRLNVRILEIWQKMNDSMKQAGDIEDLQQATLACVQVTSTPRVFTICDIQLIEYRTATRQVSWLSYLVQ